MISLSFSDCRTQLIFCVVRVSSPVVSPCFLCLVTFVVGGLDGLSPGVS